MPFYLNGFVGAAGSLWYFPLMNLILFGISLYLLSQKRTIIIDNSAQQVTLKKRSLYQTTLPVGCLSRNHNAQASALTRCIAVLPLPAPHPHKLFPCRLFACSRRAASLFCWTVVASEDWKSWADVSVADLINSW